MEDNNQASGRKFTQQTAMAGAALIGFRKGERVKWQVPAGKRTFTILDVINEQ